MVSSQAKSAYQQTAMQTNYHPVELIHMLYERVLVHLELAEVAIQKNEPIARAEHMNKAIAIVTELYVSVKSDDDSEASQFLLGLYEAILAELPKVGASKDVEILRHSHRYLKRLKEVWEDTAMREHGFTPHERENSAPCVVVVSSEETELAPVRDGGAYSPSPQDASPGHVSFSV
ncbi:MAG: flagellar export chaperone FliS [Desulfobulbaceae bacterium]|nr:flagellar export chaperone FliS [Desulfobulbaceae bacterium]